jgi:hypothetical protein
MRDLDASDVVPQFPKLLSIHSRRHRRLDEWPLLGVLAICLNGRNAGA